MQDQKYVRKPTTAIKYLFSFTPFEVVFGWKCASSRDPNVFHAENSLLNPFILDSVGKFWGKTLQIFPYYCLSSLESKRKYKKCSVFKVIIFLLYFLHSKNVIKLFRFPSLELQNHDILTSWCPRHKGALSITRNCSAPPLVKLVWKEWVLFFHWGKSFHRAWAVWLI